MAITAADVVPLTQARANLSELADQVKDNEQACWDSRTRHLRHSGCSAWSVVTNARRVRRPASSETPPGAVNSRIALDPSQTDSCCRIERCVSWIERFALSGSLHEPASGMPRMVIAVYRRASAVNPTCSSPCLPRRLFRPRGPW